MVVPPDSICSVTNVNPAPVSARSARRWILGLRTAPGIRVIPGADGARSAPNNATERQRAVATPTENETRRRFTVGCRLTVELRCGPATPARTNNRHCTGRTESAAQRAARQLQRVRCCRHAEAALGLLVATKTPPELKGRGDETPDNHDDAHGNQDGQHEDSRPRKLPRLTFRFALTRFEL